MSTVLIESRSARDARTTPELQFTLERLQAAVTAARVRCADGFLEDIWVDIFEAEHLLHSCFGRDGSLKRLTCSLEEYVNPVG
jgi:hypothetical protein